ncbi:MAG TPA: NAD(P)-binding protein [Thermoanaerobaculales bacterium]|nr:NAD(P)-binding protein [Thermoanaerobaculales bacterium]HQL31412.1 NAD(P)-binding protein [Thermoanaerobaculales bacterium]
MGLLKEKKRSKRLAARLSGAGGSGSQISPLRPRYLEQPPPCTGGCPSGNDVRGFLTAIGLREKLGAGLDDACESAWRVCMETNPFPSVMGRICPHPCEDHCNRTEKDGAVGISSVERFIGDLALERGLAPAPIAGEGPKRERVAVVGAGPSGMSCAYQLARRGYRTTVFEALPRPGGMLRYGIPSYRLPREVLDAEIRRIVGLGVELACGTRIGRDLPFEDLRSGFDAVYVAIGAHQGKSLGIPGEDGPGVWTGTDFLNHVASGKQVEVGGRLVVVGGGDTAIDAARVSMRVMLDSAAVSRRLGADVTILCLETRAEMPAIEREVEEALEEGIRIEHASAAVEILRDERGVVRAVVVQRIRPGGMDDWLRGRRDSIVGEAYQLPADTVITAVSQQPRLAELAAGGLGDGWLSADAWGRTGVAGVWTGGDSTGLGIATRSIGQARRAAECIHAALRGGLPAEVDPDKPVLRDRMKLDWYEPRARASRRVMAPEERLARPEQEVDAGLTRDDALAEAARCMSCGKCFGCEACWMYCQNNCFVKVQQPLHGSFYTVKLEVCDGCKKCWEECPCGFIVGE